MASSTVPVKTGKIPFAVPDAGRECLTAYWIHGELPPTTGGSIPLICLHGGPGAPHIPDEPIEALASTHGITVIFYDQLGCGESTRLPEKKGDGKFWTPGLFIKELENLIRALGITQYDLYGHSWGGLLAAHYATQRPKALRRLIISNSPASLQDRVKSVSELRLALPQDVQETLSKHEANGTTADPAYRQAFQVFFSQHACRVKPMPVTLMKGLAAMQEDNTVYATMRGPDMMLVTGTLKDFDITNELKQIDVSTLVISGKHEDAEGGTFVMEPYVKNIKGVTWKRFENSSHMPLYEEPEECLQVIGDFLQAE